MRNLGVTIDRNCTFSCHVNDICKNMKKAFHSISTIGLTNALATSFPGSLFSASIVVGREDPGNEVDALVISRIDYCNSLLYGLPKSEIAKLQRVQNTAARLVSLAPKYDHTTPLLRDLHWRIQLKIILLVWKLLHGCGL